MAWYPESFTCDGCGERIDVGCCPNCTKPERQEASSGRYRVIQIEIERNRSEVIKRFWNKRAAQRFASEAHQIEGSFRLIYENRTFVGGVCWQAVSTEIWDRARQIAERADAGPAHE